MHGDRNQPLYSASVRIEPVLLEHLLRMLSLIIQLDEQTTLSPILPHFCLQARVPHFYRPLYANRALLAPNRQVHGHILLRQIDNRIRVLRVRVVLGSVMLLLVMVHTEHGTQLAELILLELLDVGLKGTHPEVSLLRL